MDKNETFPMLVSAYDALKKMLSKLEKENEDLKIEMDQLKIENMQLKIEKEKLIELPQRLINSHLYHLGVYNEITSGIQQLMEIDREQQYSLLGDKLVEVAELVEVEENLLHRAIDKLS